MSRMKKKASSSHAPLPPILVRLTAVLLDIANNEAQARPAIDEGKDHDAETQVTGTNDGDVSSAPPRARNKPRVRPNGH